jgi:glycosyltransferase involved in cell wall biosynthesis
MKVAIVHDWFVTYAGSERVVEQMLACYPQADVFSLVDFLPEADRGMLGGRSVRTSFIQHLPWARKRFRLYLGLMPLAVEQLNLSEYDLVLSSSHAVAKGVLVGPDQLHICMCYSPMRYAWDLQHQYLQESRLDKGFKSWPTRWLLHKMRLWDCRTAAGVDHFIAISEYIGRRIVKAYRRESSVIYPPVDVEKFSVDNSREGFYLAASRLVPYKKMPLIVEAFNRMPSRRLVVIGDGPDADRCRALAGPNVSLLGYQSDEVLRDHMQRAKAFVFAAEEDFGITAVEAQACGTPVIAFGKGGALETIQGLGATKPSGLFFDEQTPESIVGAVHAFEVLPPNTITAQACRENAERFGVQRFRDEFSSFVNKSWQDFQRNRTTHRL